MEDEKSLREEIESAVEQVNSPETVDDSPEVVEEVEEPDAKVEEVEPAPTSLSGYMRDKWKELPAELRSEVIKREEDLHRKLTAGDSEYHFGRTMKEVVSPYMAMINSEGGKPETAVRDLLNTAYLLRTATPDQKVDLLYQIAKTYKIPVDFPQQEAVDPTIQDLKQQIEQLRQVANPDHLKKQLQEQMEVDRINSEVNTFAADPSKIHFQKVRSQMGALIGGGQAKDMQEAYDMACWAHPEIRSTLLAKTQADDIAKRKEEMNAKKKAGSSLTGSPGTIPSFTSPDRSLREELQAQFRAAAS